MNIIQHIERRSKHTTHSKQTVKRLSRLLYRRLRNDSLLKLNTSRGIFRRMFCLSVSLMVLGCSDSPPTHLRSPSEFTAPNPSLNVGGDGDPFATHRLFTIDITLDENDFALLKQEGRTLAETSRSCIPDFHYTEFPATVAIDGERMEQVRVRKKGFLGSLSAIKPSIKLDFDDIQLGQTYQHLHQMTLNNNRQDPSNVRQCLSYELFRQAGLPAPQCNYAKVSVNGEPLGIYTHVESVRSEFLVKHFGSDDGNLYEAQLADLAQHLIKKYEKKNNQPFNDRSDLYELAEIISLPDAEFIDNIGDHIDIDAFIKFWAIETLIGQWDSASGNANNYFLYHSPNDDRFHFIPWGADSSFIGRHTLKPTSSPLYRNFRLSARLYDIPQFRQQYFDTINHYLNTLWDEAALTTSINAIAALTATPENDLASVIDFINGKNVLEERTIPSQREKLTQAMNSENNNGDLHFIPNQMADCSPPISSDLIVTANTTNGIDTGSFSFSLPSGQRVNASITLASLGIDSLVVTETSDTNPAVYSILLIGVDANQSFKPYALQLFVEKQPLLNREIPFHGFANSALLFEVDANAPLGIKSLALGNRGSFTFTDFRIIDTDTLVNITVNADIEFLSEDN